MWSFADPAASEERFRKELARTADPERRAELKTQIARAQGLQRRFDLANATLEQAAKEIRPEWRRAWIRLKLERGRVQNSSGDRQGSAQEFLQAFALASGSREDFLAVDAAHMMAIVAEADHKLDWNLRALELSRASKDPEARDWQGSLLNNLAWALHDSGRLDEALARFEEALAFRRSQGVPGAVRVAEWSVGKALRSLGRLVEALAIQERLAEDDADGFVFEELGECLLALGRSSEARGFFAKAFDLLSKDAWLSEREPERFARLASLADGA